MAGWFSFPLMGATAGDLMVRDVAVEWLQDAGFTCDVAHSSAFDGGVDWESVDPSRYALVAFVCGPLGNGEPASDFLNRFRDIPLLGLNLSMLQPLDEWNPFAKLLERDSDRAARPDLSFVHGGGLVPIVGMILVHRQQEYRDAIHGKVNAAIQRFLATREISIVSIDTCFDPPNKTGLRTPTEVESLIAHMDVVITTRLHGLVLALKNSVPALAVDPVPGGAKIRRQAEAIGWPLVLTAEQVNEDTLGPSFDRCLKPETRRLATECSQRAKQKIELARGELEEWLSTRTED